MLSGGLSSFALVHKQAQTEAAESHSSLVQSNNHSKAWSAYTWEEKGKLLLCLFKFQYYASTFFGFYH